jgi:branched-chain amino acid transport system permease protein
VVTEASRQPLESTSRFRLSLSAVFGAILVALLLVWLGVNFYKTPSDFIQIFLIGFTLGALYALIALGYTLVYGILELINFAHGDVFMLGGMMSVTLVGTTVFNLHQGSAWYVLWPLVIVALLVAMTFCGVLNATVELIAYRRLRNAPRLAPLITAIGASFILQNVGLAWKGPNYVQTANVLPTGNVFSVGGVQYTWE